MLDVEGINLLNVPSHKCEESLKKITVYFNIYSSLVTSTMEDIKNGDTAFQLGAEFAKA